MDFASLWNGVRASWPFDRENYPDFPDAATHGTGKQRIFAIRHIMDHWCTALGQLARACEPADHGKGFDQPAAEEAVVNMFRNAVRAADVLGMDPEPFVKRVLGSPH